MASILPPENLCFSYWAGLFVLTALTFLVYQIMKPLQYYSQQEPKVDIPPGSRGLPLIGETLHFMAAIYSGKGFYEFVRLRRLRYGKCFKTNIFGGTHVFVSSTKSAKVILNNDSGKFGKRYIKSIAELVGNQSLLCASHQHHKLLRGQLGSLFSTNSLSVFIKQFDQLIVEALKGWEHQSTVVIQDEALKITCKAMCKMLLSVESGYELEVLQKEVAHVCEAMLAFPLRFPGTRFNKGLQGRKKIMLIIDKAMRERRGRRLRADEDDFLQQILRNEAGGNGLTDEEVKDNILTMVIAGQDTTATAVTWMVKFLGENPEVLHNLMKEQLDLWRKTSSKSFLTLESINEMPFASKVVKESLRLASIVPWFPRLALEDCEMEGFRIKKGWNVNVDAKSVHLDPTVYIDPGKFNPSRFDDEYSKGGHSRFLAFGMGGRTCLGMNMAKAMMLVFLHRLVTTYRWKVIDQDSSIEKWGLFSKLRSGCPVIVTRIDEDILLV
ncbi:putative 3-epi-6-deoxocathasterone 23-monooxygenase [Rosa chinensis]|uniref:Putative 3-epi-6-deoxocathasterone 23-monooxygenase n=1 Tax=Rosa chinensis TaxID=74649 RepID=A0A2P6PYR7_ROSCH|nr:cytochrome P450 90D2 isoform X2 [Rosa chinensis]PRQ27078.1 putative 3-epi-6-deoxocathasterone 23-monooxygenase [Rosa chinensis]